MKNDTPWKLWLDDDCFDPSATKRHPPKGFLGAASVKEAQDLIQILGFPAEMDLDHDLGEGVPNGKDFCVWLYHQMPEGSAPPKWMVHSRNVGGGYDNIVSYLRSWEKSLEI